MTADSQLAERIAEALMGWAERNNDPRHTLLRRTETVIANARGRAAAALAVVQPEIDRLRAERDQARRWAVALEQELAHVQAGGTL